MEKPKKQRIQIDVGNTVVDNEMFIPNKTSDNARKVGDQNLEIFFEIWFDKHLSVRQQFGDDNGKRIGISTDEILPLVKDLFIHIIYFTLEFDQFSFLKQEKRIVIKDGIKNIEEPLHIVLEIHSKCIDNKTIFEITVKTAMCVYDFKMKDG